MDQLVSAFPVKLYYNADSGDLYRPRGLSVDDESILYENEYHSNLFFDELKDWQGMLAQYQENRWRNIACVARKTDLLNGTKKAALDYGCGTGGLADKLAQKGFETTAIDISPSSLELARKQFPHVQFRLIDEFDFAAGEGKYSLITLSHVLEHLNDPVETLKKLRPLLKDDGCLYIEVPLLSSKALRLRPHWFMQLDHHWEFTRKGLAQRVHESGYEIIAHNHSMEFSHPEPYQFLLAQKKE